MLQSEKWIEVNLAAIRHNWQSLKASLAPGVKLCAVLKADAYGHGAPAVAQALKDADCLAVTSLAEAVAIRQNGVTTPILVFMPPLAAQIPAFLAHNLMPTVDSLACLQALAAQTPQGKVTECHLKVDTGFSRFGAEPQAAEQIIRAGLELPQIKISGIYSHFATATSVNSAATAQLNQFLAVYQAAKGMLPDICGHMAASAAYSNYPTSHLDMVRIGTLLYGQKPVKNDLALQNTWQLKSSIMAVKAIDRGTAVGYGREYVAKEAMQLAVLPLGYADGFGVSIKARRQTLSNALGESMVSIGKAALNKIEFGAYYQGRLLPVVGRIGMQLSCIDITGTDLQVGAVVDVPMRRTTASALIEKVYLGAKDQVLA